MTEQMVSIKSGNLNLEGIYRDAPGTKAVLMTHPHPLYGGDMYNPVVTAVLSAYENHGFSSLRFNFRGCGRSDGSFDQGNGEQKDVWAALDFLVDKGKTLIDLAGYSFGSWVNARGLSSYGSIARAVFVSPPVDYFDFSFLEQHPVIKLVITASQDTYAPPEKLKKMLPEWNPEAAFHVIQGADHFYGWHSSEITSIVENFLKTHEQNLPT